MDNPYDIEIAEKQRSKEFLTAFVALPAIAASAMILLASGVLFRERNEPIVQAQDLGGSQ